METEMTNELRRKFFAQYYGQSVFSRKSYAQKGATMEVVGGLLDTDISDAFLLLKPLSSITDEDAIEIIKIFRNVSHSDRYVEFIRWDWCLRMVINREPHINDPSVELDAIIEINFENSPTPNSLRFIVEHKSGKGVGVEDRGFGDSLTCYDYLRSKSYALPFMGISVEQQVQSGWVKLITDK